MNKKANLNKIWISIIFFGIFLFIFLFFTVGLKQIISDNMIEPTLTAVNSIPDSPLTPETTATLNSFKTDFDKPFFNYDIFFLVLVIGFTIISIVSSYKTIKLGFRSFFGYLTVGSWLFMLLLGFMNQVTDWLILNFYTNLFDTTLVSTPIINWFIQYLSFYCFGLFLICILVNQIDFAQILRRDEGVVEE